MEIQTRTLTLLTPNDFDMDEYIRGICSGYCSYVVIFE
jgi:hypothetical protein